MATTDSEELNSKDEILLRVPSHMAQLSIGFALDAGGSVTKLLYRSKEDYNNGKRVADDDSDHGQLRMRYFPAGDDETLISFLLDHCDVMESARKAEDGWFQTGVQTQRFKERLEEVFQVKFKTISEPDSAFRGLHGFYSKVPDCRPLALGTAAVDRALETTRGFLQMMQGSQEIGDDSFREVFLKTDPDVIIQHTTKLMTIDGATLAKELSQHEFEWPLLCATLGSGLSMMVMTEVGNYDVGTFSGVSGKTFLGLGKVLCGAKDFDELIDMASLGDHRKVDTMSGDMKVRGRKEEDWYSIMPDNFVIFTLGKLAEDSYNGTFTKEDLAAGVLNMILSVVAKIAVLTARLSKVKCVVFTGSVVNRKVAREALQSWLLDESLMQPFIGEEQMKWMFVPHPGFVCAFGAWYQNWEIEEQKRKTTSESTYVQLV